MDSSSTFSRTLWILAFGLPGALSYGGQQVQAQQPALQSSAQQTEDLKKQLEELRKQYEATTREMGERIAALEQQIDKQNNDSGKAKGDVVRQAAQSAGEQATQGALRGGSNQVGGKYQGQVPSEPTYDLLNEAETKITRLEEQAKAFEFHGYFR